MDLLTNVNVIEVNRCQNVKVNKLKKNGVKKKNSFNCEICAKILTSKFHYEKHKKTVHVLKDFVCDFDGKHFNTKDKLRLHILQHRKYYRVECTVCGKAYTTDQSMRKHLRTHFEIHQCELCGQTFKYKNLLLNHVAAVHDKEQSIPCSYCTRLFPNTVTRDNHQRSIHQNQKIDTKHFKCNECPQGFEMREELRIHSFIHFNGDIHTCLECHQIFKKKRHLQIHMTKHETTTFRCEGCDQTFKYKSNLGKHQRAKRCRGIIEEISKVENISPEDEAIIAKTQLITMSAFPIKENIVEELKIPVKSKKPSKIPEKVKTKRSSRLKTLKKIPRKVRIVKGSSSSYICDLCGFEVLYKSHMLSHIRSHISSRRHKCLECSETFNTQMQLQKHSLKSHGHGIIGSVMYSKESSMCPICGQIFSKERMKYHLQHHEEELFHCDQCPKVFKKKISLQRHFDCNHSTEKRFVCSTCGKSFAKNRVLKQHEMIHSSIKLYIRCEVCLKLMQVKSLRIHMETKHGDKYKEKPFICDCGKSFRYEKQLMKHNESVHEKIDRGIVYPCSDCTLTFRRRNELREHSFDHYAGKIFQCECGMKFKKKKLLTIHAIVHRNDVSFPCELCPVTFQTKGGRRKHMIKVHNQPSNEIIEISSDIKFTIIEN